MSAQRMSIGPFYSEILSALTTLRGLPTFDASLTRDQVEEVGQAKSALRQWIKDHPGEGDEAERAICVKIIAQLRRASRREWQCNECEARFNLDFDELDGANEEPACSECGSVDLEPAGV